MRALVCALALVSFALPACARTSSTPQPAQAATAAAVAPTAPKNVEIVATRNLTRRVKLVGFVSVDEEKGNKEKAVEALRQKAAALGADAVTNIEFHEGVGEPAHYSGVAVKYRKNRTKKPRAPEQPMPEQRHEK